MQQIRVLIVDDSAFMRRMITDILESDKRIKVVGTARNGEDGLRKMKAISPDVVTLDVEMPIMDGITTLKKTMEINPLPVVMLSSVTSEGATKTLQAIALGAVDFVAKPSGAISLNINEIKDEIINKVITASQANVLKRNQVIERVPQDVVRRQSYSKAIVAIGTSTGGPRALEQILTGFTKCFPAPILIVQHMPASFTKSLAKRLDSLANIHIKEACHGDIIRKGTAYIAPGNYHMQIRKVGTTLAIELSQGPPKSGHRPAVDVLLNSLASINKVNKIAVILTGMGKDGSAGIQQLKKMDPETVVLAEAEESSIVYGMPGAAIETGYVNEIAHLNKMGETITHLVNRSGRV